MDETAYSKLSGTLILSFAGTISACAELIIKKSPETQVSPCLSTKMANSAPCPWRGAASRLFVLLAFPLVIDLNFVIALFFGIKKAQKINKNEVRHYFLPFQKSTSFEIFGLVAEIHLESSFF